MSELELNFDYPYTNDRGDEVQYLVPKNFSVLPETEKNKIVHVYQARNKNAKKLDTVLTDLTRISDQMRRADAQRKAADVGAADAAADAAAAGAGAQRRAADAGGAGAGAGGLMDDTGFESGIDDAAALRTADDDDATRRTAALKNSSPIKHSQFSKFDERRFNNLKNSREKRIENMNRMEKWLKKFKPRTSEDEVEMVRVQKMLIEHMEAESEYERLNDILRRGIRQERQPYDETHKEEDSFKSATVPDITFDKNGKLLTPLGLPATQQNMRQESMFTPLRKRFAATARNYGLVDGTKHYVKPASSEFFGKNAKVLQTTIADINGQMYLLDAKGASDVQLATDKTGNLKTGDLNLGQYEGEYPSAIISFPENKKNALRMLNDGEHLSLGVFDEGSNKISLNNYDKTMKTMQDARKQQGFETGSGLSPLAASIRQGVSDVKQYGFKSGSSVGTPSQLGVREWAGGGELGGGRKVIRKTKKHPTNSNKKSNKKIRRIRKSSKRIR